MCHGYGHDPYRAGCCYQHGGAQIFGHHPGHGLIFPSKKDQIEHLKEYRQRLQDLQKEVEERLKDLGQE
jgi:hypothetical protein